MNIKEVLKPSHIIAKTKEIVHNIPSYIKTIYLFSTFFLLLNFFLVGKIYGLLTRTPFLGKLISKLGEFWTNRFSKKFNLLIEKLEANRPSEVKRIYLIELAYRNMMIKKTRSLITIFGMSVGVGAIVLLLSLGYGVERLIISKVARLDELKMLDISAGENTALRLNEELFKKISNIKEAIKTLPVISVVGRINYNRAQTDVLVYAVSNDYLIQGINNKIIKGKPFANNNTIKTASAKATTGGEVAGLSSELLEATLGARINNEKVIFNILPESPAAVWEDCSINSKLVGYTARIQGQYEGVEYWGSDYYPFSQDGRVGYDREKNVFLGRWIKSTVPVFNKTGENALEPIIGDNGRQDYKEVCIATRDIQVIDKYQFAEVLGESTGSALLAETVLSASDEAVIGSDSAYLTSDTVASGEGGLETVSLASSSAKTKEIETLKFEQKPDGEAVVSSGFLNLLGIDLNRAIGTTFKSSFIIVKSLMPDIEGKVFTSEVEYKIIGVVDDADNTYFYIPFEDLYRLGIKNFSQFKLVLASQNDLPKVRKNIETMGFRTTSTFDTVKQIESLFANLRLLLAVLGMVALGVASLGMFNTLTVSLLERTRETGGMKAIGMVSEEVQDLFLAEAMIMGIAGGLGGLAFGSSVGWTLSILISIVAISQGQGFLQLNYLPPAFVIFIIISAFIVGLLTGLYTA